MGEIASVLMTMGTGEAGAAGMTAMATGGGVEGAAGAMIGGGAGAMIGGSAAGGIGAALGEAAATEAFAPVTAAVEGGAEVAAAGDVALAEMDNAIMQDPSLMANDEAFIKEAAESAQSSSGSGGVKDFFSQAWDNAKNDLGKNVVRNADGSVNYGRTAGNFGYGIGKAALLKAINAKDQEMPDQDQQQQHPPMKFSQAEPVNAEDELNRLRNRMNVS